MKQIIDFPCISFAQLPTPLYKLENLSRKIGKNIYIKRDDMTGVALGGNKVRKLEFLLADARSKGTDVVLTAGGPQSNHAMLTAACAGQLGMESILVLKKRGDFTSGNLILDSIFGAEVRLVDTDSYDDIYAEMDQIMEQLRAQGHIPYAIPVGGSVPLGSLGYINCTNGISNQTQELGIPFDACIHRRPRATCTEILSLAAGEIEPPRRSREPAVGAHHAGGERHCCESSFRG